MHQGMSKLTQLSRGVGDGIWLPKTFKYNASCDLNSINRNFLNGCFEVRETCKEKLLINFSYCSNKVWVDFFLMN